MKRFAHLLEKNEVCTRPESMIFLDTETIPQRISKWETRQNFRLGVAHYWRQRRDERPDNHEWLEFTRTADFWVWAISKVRSNSTLYLIAHNIAFDAHVVQSFAHLPGLGWKMLFRYESGFTRLFKWGYPTKALSAWLNDGKPIYEFQGHRWSKTLLMMDNCNLFAGSIEKWGMAVGFPKMTRPAYTAPDTEWFPYCKRDVEIMVKLWEQWFPFLDEHGLGIFHTTIGSQAFSGYRHSYMNHKIYIHTDDVATRLERSAYYGGRTEPFYVGQIEGETLYKLDVNSMYPHVMRRYLYPTHLQKVGTSMTMEDLHLSLDRGGIIATVELECKEPIFPQKLTDKNVYPIGQFAATLTTPELRYAYDRHWIVKVGEYATYRMRDIFAEYVDYFYALKLRYQATGDNLHRSLVKLLLNSLYGKFGQSGYEDRIIGTCEPDEWSVSYGYDATDRHPFTIYRGGGTIIQQNRCGEGFNSFVAIAAHVTAYGRMYLWNLICRAGKRNVYYVDTDSLIVNRAGYDALAPLVNPERLGYLKVEATATTLEIRSPKDYLFGQHLVRKGVPVEAEEVDTDTYSFETWPSMNSQLAAGHTDTYYNRNVTKHLTYDVDWGEPQDDGWIEPYYLGVSPLFL
jgi:hypothetical protein